MPIPVERHGPQEEECIDLPYQPVTAFAVKEVQPRLPVPISIIGNRERSECRPDGLTSSRGIATETEQEAKAVALFEEPVYLIPDLFRLSRGPELLGDQSMEPAKRRIAFHEP